MWGNVDLYLGLDLHSHEGVVQWGLDIRMRKRTKDMDRELIFGRTDCTL